MHRIDTDFRIKAMSDEGLLEGYGSVYNVTDTDGERVVAGAFKASLARLAEQGLNLPILWQHKSDSVIGVWQSIVEDGRGLKLKGQLAMLTTAGREAYELLKMKAVSGLSIGALLKAAPRKAADGIYELTDLDLREVSVVTFPANHEARITGIKSAGGRFTFETKRTSERALRDVGLSQQQAKTVISVGFKELERDVPGADEESLAKAQSILNTLTKGITQCQN